MFSIRLPIPRIHDATRVEVRIMPSWDIWTMASIIILDYSRFSRGRTVLMVSRFCLPGAGEASIRSLSFHNEHGAENLAVLEERWEGSKIPNAGIRIRFKKITDTPFRVPFETTTTIGGEAARPRSVRGVNERLEINARKAVAAPDSVSVEDLQALLTEFRTHNMLQAFPRALECRLIAYYLQCDPNRDDLRARLAQLDRMDTSEMPLVRVACKSNPKTSAALDGIEARIGAIEDSETRYREIVCCYHRSQRRRRFPA